MKLEIDKDRKWINHRGEFLKADFSSLNSHSERIHDNFKFVKLSVTLHADQHLFPNTKDIGK